MQTSKFSNSCKELAFSWNFCAFLVCSWSALNAEWIFSSFSSLSPASIIWIFFSSPKHWFSSSSNSFLNIPKLMWSPGTQTWNREPFSLVSFMSFFKAMKWTLLRPENGLSYLCFEMNIFIFNLKKYFTTWPPVLRRIVAPGWDCERKCRMMNNPNSSFRDE